MRIITETPNIVRAFLWMMATVCIFMLLAVSVRELSAHFTTFQILFWRSVAGLAVMLVLLHLHGWETARTRRPLAHVGRNVIHFLGQYSFFFGIAVLPIAQVFAIEFTVPIWVLIIAAIVLGEEINRWRAMSVALGFAGVLLILRPGFSEIEVAQLVVLAGAFCYATSGVLVKTLVTTDAPLTILFYMCAIQLPLSFVFALDDWNWPAGSQWLWTALVGTSALGAHYCITRALRLADASVVTPMEFFRLPLAIVVGFLAYGEVIEWWVFAGAAVIVAGNVVNMVRETRQQRRAERIAIETASP